MLKEIIQAAKQRNPGLVQLDVRQESLFPNKSGIRAASTISPTSPTFPEPTIPDKHRLMPSDNPVNASLTSESGTPVIYSPRSFLPKANAKKLSKKQALKSKKDKQKAQDSVDSSNDNTNSSVTNNPTDEAGHVESGTNQEPTTDPSTSQTQESTNLTISSGEGKSSLYDEIFGDASMIQFPSPDSDVNMEPIYSKVVKVPESSSQFDVSVEVHSREPTSREESPDNSGTQLSPLITSSTTYEESETNIGNPDNLSNFEQGEKQDKTNDNLQKDKPQGILKSTSPREMSIDYSGRTGKLRSSKGSLTQNAQYSLPKENYKRFDKKKDDDVNEVTEWFKTIVVFLAFCVLAGLIAMAVIFTVFYGGLNEKKLVESVEDTETHFEINITLPQLEFQQNLHNPKSEIYISTTYAILKYIDDLLENHSSALVKRNYEYAAIKSYTDRNSLTLIDVAFFLKNDAKDSKLETIKESIATTLHKESSNWSF